MTRPQKEVAKVAIIDQEDNYLLLYRTNHPVFGNDPDLPGGTLEAGESILEALEREVDEEIGAPISQESLQQVYAGNDYGTDHYVLFTARVEMRPEIQLSWEHDRYAWLSRHDFLAAAHSANDTYMHMAYDVLNELPNNK